MSLSDISIEYYQYDPELTATKTLIYGRLVSSHEDGVTNEIKQTVAPGTATYCSILAQVALFVEISHETPTVLSSRRFS